jgi:S1-C subfamily serine protease
MDDPTTPPEPAWRDRLRKLRGILKQGLVFAGGVLAALAALLIYRSLYPPPRPMTASEFNNSVAQVMASATPQPAFSEQVFRQIQPSLVLIQTKSTNAAGKEENSLGSGVIINDSGDILTSLHVVANATSIHLTFADGTQSSAQVKTSQPDNDIAVLTADQPPAQIIPATLGNPTAMRIGDEAYAVGNPFGLYASMSAGVISGFNRSFTPAYSDHALQGLIQIDAAVNPGNSGGPLLNRDGAVIGIVEGIINPTDQDVFIGIGFAVPITTAGGGGALGSPPD